MHGRRQMREAAAAGDVWRASKTLASFHDDSTYLSIIEIAMQLRSTQPLAFDHIAVCVRNRELKDSLRQINCYSRGCHWTTPVFANQTTRHCN
jgi:hypothetical protein